MTLLKASKRLDRLYVHAVDQRKGVVGLPSEIASGVEKEMRTRHQHQEALQRQKELVTRCRGIEVEDYSRRTAEDAQRHEIYAANKLGVKKLKHQSPIGGRSASKIMFMRFSGHAISLLPRIINTRRKVLSRKPPATRLCEIVSRHRG